MKKSNICSVLALRRAAIPRTRLVTRGVILVLLVSVFIGCLSVVRPAGVHAQATQPQAAGQQNAATVQTHAQNGTIRRLDVFVRGTYHELLHRWTAWGSGFWTAWESLGQHLDSAPAATADPADTGVIDVFFRNGPDLWRGKIFISGAQPSWENLGHDCQRSILGFCGSVPAFTSAPAVTSSPQGGIYQPGHLDVFAFAGPHLLMHEWLNPVFDTITGQIATYEWSDWEYLSNADFADDPAVVSWGPGRMDVFVHGSDDAHLYDKIYDQGHWNNWLDLGGTLTAGPTAASWVPGHFVAFTRDTVGGLSARGYWGHWFDWSVVDDSRVFVGAPAVSTWGGDTYTWDIFALGTDGSLLHKWYNPGGWTEWETLGSGFTSAPAALVGTYA